jgi:hypothetical protein
MTMKARDLPEWKLWQQAIQEAASASTRLSEAYSAVDIDAAADAYQALSDAETAFLEADRRRRETHEILRAVIRAQRPRNSGPHAS